MVSTRKLEGELTSRSGWTFTSEAVQNRVARTQIEGQNGGDCGGLGGRRHRANAGGRGFRDRGVPLTLPRPSPELDTLEVGGSG
jgi:hypothetical protein